MKILLVEDNELVRETVETLLQCLGHKVVAAADKGLACQIIQEQLKTIDLVVTDCDLPTPNEGLEIINFTRDLTEFKLMNDIPAILMSGRDKSAEAENAGAEFIHKPFTLAELIALIQRTESKKAIFA